MQLAGPQLFIWWIIPVQMNSLILNYSLLIYLVVLLSNI